MFYDSHYPEEDSVSISDLSIITPTLDHKQSPRPNSDIDYPCNWTVDEVTKWLNDVALQQYSDNFRKHDIDGAVLVDEIDGVNDDTIKQLIPSLGAQMKFKKALRTLRR